MYIYICIYFEGFCEFSVSSKTKVKNPSSLGETSKEYAA